MEELAILLRSDSRDDGAGSLLRWTVFDGWRWETCKEAASRVDDSFDILGGD